MKYITILLLILLSACSSVQNKPSIIETEKSQSDTEQLLSQGYELISKNQPADAIAIFDKVIESCGPQYNNSQQVHYAARGPAETLYYMLLAASQNKSAIAVASTCADVLYLKGYANIELGQLDTAEEYLLRAVAMSPVNALYLSELGHIYQAKNDWEKALKTFSDAEQNVEAYTPPESKITELARAKRGAGFALIELSRLDEAEVKFNECLEINSDDQKALNELIYISSLRSK